MSLFVNQNSQTLKLKISVWTTYTKPDNRRTHEIFAWCNSAGGLCPGTVFLRQTTPWSCARGLSSLWNVFLLEVLEDSSGFWTLHRGKIKAVVEDKWVKTVYKWRICFCGKEMVHSTGNFYIASMTTQWLLWVRLRSLYTGTGHIRATTTWLDIISKDY